MTTTTTFAEFQAGNGLERKIYFVVNELQNWRNVKYMARSYVKFAILKIRKQMFLAKVRVKIISAY